MKYGCPSIFDDYNILSGIRYDETYFGLPSILNLILNIVLFSEGGRRRGKDKSQSNFAPTAWFNVQLIVQTDDHGYNEYGHRQ